MNFFSPKSAALRYAVGRPSFHPAIIRRVREYLSLSEPLTRALDVGCGTGLSTLALKEIAEEIIGLDASTEMVALAPTDARIQYCIANAEYLPLRERTFDLITLSQVFHWLDRERFLKEAGRTLRGRGWLIVYDNYFSGQTEGNAEFQRWHQESFLKKYPSPHRAWASFTEENTRDEGFELLNHEWHQNGIKFSVEALADYLTTQSNMIAAVEGGRETIEEARAWLLENIRPLFGERQEAEFTFNAPIWYLRRIE
nr:Methyltransferase domain protein [uncultured bacterium]